MNNKALQVVFLSPIGARHKYLLILFPFSYQVYNPASDTRPASFLLNYLRGPVWLSHNKIAPALDAAQTTSLGYKIISRRRSVQTFPRPSPKILTTPRYFDGSCSTLQGFHENWLMKMWSLLFQLIGQQSLFSILHRAIFHLAVISTIEQIGEAKISWNILLYAGQSLSRCPLILQ